MIYKKKLIIAIKLMNGISVIVNKERLDSKTKLEKYSEEANFQLLQKQISKIVQQNQKLAQTLFLILPLSSKINNSEYNKKDFLRFK